MIGLAEWFAFLINGTTFDFLSNRTFGEGKEGSGSLVQTIGFLGHSLLRLKSLTGEPSMYALTVFPYMVFSFANRARKAGSLFFLTLLLSTSTSAFLGFFVIGLLLIGVYKKGFGLKFTYFIFSMFFTVGTYILFKDTVYSMIFQKLALENTSGIDRFFNFYSSFVFWNDSGALIKLFGIGWGTIRSTDMLTTLLVNTGILGLLGWVIFFLAPMMNIQKSDKPTFILFLGMIAVLIMLLVSISEYSYLTTWMFLGIIYNKTNTRFNILKCY